MLYKSLRLFVPGNFMLSQVVSTDRVWLGAYPCPQFQHPGELHVISLEEEELQMTKTSHPK
uniref:Uncharacterized protein n=1 Tax=Triticum urartu TaxID=4572 RepID=A0A8R7PG79_TRIUA